MATIDPKIPKMPTSEGWASSANLAIFGWETQAKRAYVGLAINTVYGII